MIRRQFNRARLKHCFGDSFAHAFFCEIRKRENTGQLIKALKEDDSEFVKTMGLKLSNGTKYRKKASEYEAMKERALSEYTKLLVLKKAKKVKFYLLAFTGLYVFLEAVKYYYVIYYYIMYDLDIRKPRVSDYIIERFR